MRDIHLILTFLFFLLYTEICCLLDSESEDGHCNSMNSMLNPPCDENELIEFLADTQIINPESIVELAVDSLDPLCRNLCKHLRALDEYLKKCSITNDMVLYISLIDGVKILRDKLCIDGEFYRRFQNHYHCLHELRHDFESCNAPADWNEETDKHQICSDYKKMLDCYYIKAAKVCGIAPAKTIKELMKDVVNAVIQIRCAKINQDPYVKDPMPPSYLKYDSIMDSNKAETARISSIAKVATFLILLL